MWSHSLHCFKLQEALAASQALGQKYRGRNEIGGDAQRGDPEQNRSGMHGRQNREELLNSAKTGIQFRGPCEKIWVVPRIIPKILRRTRCFPPYVRWGFEGKKKKSQKPACCQQAGWLGSIHVADIWISCAWHDSLKCYSDTFFPFKYNIDNFSDNTIIWTSLLGFQKAQGRMGEKCFCVMFFSLLKGDLTF